MVTFAAAERAFFEPREDIDCECGRGGDDCTCEQDALDAAEDQAIDAEQARREAILDDGPGPKWKP